MMRPLKCFLVLLVLVYISSDLAFTYPLQSQLTTQINTGLNSKNSLSTDMNDRIKELDIFYNRIKELNELQQNNDNSHDKLQGVRSFTKRMYLIAVFFVPEGVASRIFYEISMIIRKAYWILKSLKNRYVWITDEQKMKLKDKKIIWVNGPGVGEWNMVAPVIEELEKKYSDHQIVLSSRFKKNIDFTRKKFPHLESVLLPLPIKSIISKGMDDFSIDLFMMLETPFNLEEEFMDYLHERKVPTVILNGRVPRVHDHSITRQLIKKAFLEVDNSPSAKRYQKVDMILSQSELQKNRMIELGVEEERIKIINNLKFDTQIQESDEDAILSRRINLGFSSEDKILVIGSAHDLEFELFVKTYLLLKDEVENLKVIIAPRVLKELESLVPLLKSYDISYKKRTEIDQMNDKEKGFEFLILDTFGELREIYELADVAIVGGSFHPLYAGHSVIEPAVFNKPTITGSYVSSFRRIVKELLKLKGLVQVANQEALHEAVRTIFASDSLQTAIGENANGILIRNKGALEKSLLYLEEILGEPAERQSSYRFAKEEVTGMSFPKAA